MVIVRVVVMVVVMVVAMVGVGVVVMVGVGMVVMVVVMVGVGVVVMVVVMVVVVVIYWKKRKKKLFTQTHPPPPPLLHPTQPRPVITQQPTPTRHNTSFYRNTTNQHFIHLSRFKSISKPFNPHLNPHKYAQIFQTAHKILRTTPKSPKPLTDSSNFLKSTHPF